MRFICLIFLLGLPLVSGFALQKKPSNPIHIINHEFPPNSQINTIKQKETIIEKTKKTFQFRANLKKVEQERINAIFNKLITSNKKKRYSNL